MSLFSSISFLFFSPDDIISLLLQNVGMSKWSSTAIRNQDVHTNGPILDDVLLADPEVTSYFYLIPVSLAIQTIPYIPSIFSLVFWSLYWYSDRIGCLALQVN